MRYGIATGDNFFGGSSAPALLTVLACRYLSNFVELQKVAACLHLASGLNALIIDDFMEFGNERYVQHLVWANTCT